MPNVRSQRSPSTVALFAAGLLSGQARPISVTGPVHDPRPDPTASRLAYVSGRTLRVGELDGSSRRARRQRSEGGRQRLLGQCRLHRCRGDAPVPRLLVEPRRSDDRGLPCRRQPRLRVDHRRPSRPVPPGAHRPLPRCRHRQPDRHAAPARARRIPKDRRLGSRVLPVPGSRRVDRRRPADVGAVAAISAARWR